MVSGYCIGQHRLRGYRHEDCGGQRVRWSEGAPVAPVGMTLLHAIILTPLFLRVPRKA